MVSGHSLLVKGSEELHQMFACWGVIATTTDSSSATVFQASSGRGDMKEQELAGWLLRWLMAGLFLVKTHLSFPGVGKAGKAQASPWESLKRANGSVQKARFGGS